MPVSTMFSAQSMRDEVCGVTIESCHDQSDTAGAALLRGRRAVEFGQPRVAGPHLRERLPRHQPRVHAALVRRADRDQPAHGGRAVAAQVGAGDEPAHAVRDDDDLPRAGRGHRSAAIFAASWSAKSLDRVQRRPVGQRIDGVRRRGPRGSRRMPVHTPALQPTPCSSTTAARPARAAGPASATGRGSSAARTARVLRTRGRTSRSAPRTSARISAGRCARNHQASMNQKRREEERDGKVGERVADDERPRGAPCATA